MDNESQLQSYVNNFRRHISEYLKPSIGFTCNIFPVKESGAVLEFVLGPNERNEDNFKSSYQKISDVLKDVEQSAFGGNLDAFTFKGTNVVMEDGRIILIKGGDANNEWSDSAAMSDVQRIVSGG